MASLIALVDLVVFVALVVLVVIVVLDLAVYVVYGALISLVVLVVFVGIDHGPGETKDIWPQSQIFVATFEIILISGKTERICHVVGLDDIFVAVNDDGTICLFVNVVFATLNFSR